MLILYRYNPLNNVLHIRTYLLLIGFFGPTKEQKKAKADFEKWQKKFNERSPTGNHGNDFIISFYVLFYFMFHFILCLF